MSAKEAESPTAYTESSTGVNSQKGASDEFEIQAEEQDAFVPELLTAAGVDQVIKQPTAGTEVADVTEQPTAGTEVADVTEQPTAGTEVTDVTEQPTAGTEVAEATERPKAETDSTATYTSSSDISSAGPEDGAAAADKDALSGKDALPEKSAELIGITIETPTGEGRYDLKDGKYASRVFFGNGDEIKVTAEEDMYGVYIVWGYPDIRYSLTYNGVTVNGSGNGFLHDYVEFSGPTREFVITTLCYTALCDIYAYSDGKLPESVQLWEEPAGKTDMLVLSTHADDEVLFFGGAVTDAVSRGYDVRVAYLSEYWTGDYGDPRREHEKLDGLWAMGVRIYPVNLHFNDEYSTSLEGVKEVYDYDKVCLEVLRVIRRFRPEVLVTHDINGEYGHGGHMLLNAAVRDVLELTGRNGYDAGSEAEYGVWDVPKTYFHLYGSNRIRLDLRQPLEYFGGRTALEVETEAYKKHETQQWCWFYVSDDYEYSCADFGLYRSLVGDDTGNDMMEHIERNSQ